MSGEKRDEIAEQIRRVLTESPPVPDFIREFERKRENRERAVERAVADLHQRPKRVRRRSKSGPPAGTGLTPETLIDAVAARWVTEPPTQERVAEDLGLTARRVRQVAKACGDWREILRQAANRKPGAE
jgi:hypothetical protein